MPPSESSRRGAIGLDLGGSSAKIGLVSGSGEVLAFDRVLFATADNTAIVLTGLRAALHHLRDQAAVRQIELVGVGCGVSGNLDAAGSAILLNNIAALNGFPLRPWLIEQLGLPAVLDHGMQGAMRDLRDQQFDRVGPDINDGATGRGGRG